MARRYGLHAITMNEDTAAFTLSGVTGLTVNHNINAMTMGHDGEVDPTFAAIMDSAPAAQIRCADVKTVIDEIPINGLALTLCNFFYQAWASKGARASGSAHLKGAATSGIAVLRRISAQHNQLAEIEAEALLLSSDGLTQPITFTDSSALAGTVAEVAHYTLGPVMLTVSGGSATAINVQGWDLDTGINLSAISDNGLPFPTDYSIESRDPTITIRSHELSKLAATGMLGAQFAIDLYLRKVTKHGTRVANATEEHIKCSIAEALLHTDNSEGSHPGAGSMSVMVKPIFDGTNDIIAFDTTSALP